MAFDSPNYRMADKLAAGALDSILADLAGQGLSYAGIAARLFADHGIEVSAPTVGAWLRSIEQTETAA